MLNLFIYGRAIELEPLNPVKYLQYTIKSLLFRFRYIKFFNIRLFKLFFENTRDCFSFAMFSTKFDEIFRF